MSETGFIFNEGAESLRFGDYRCTVYGDEISVVNISRPGNEEAITDRAEKEYDGAFPATDMLKGKFGGKLKILEIGPGLSSFGPKAVAYQVVSEYVICEPVDYHAIGALLEEVPRYFGLSKGAKRHLRELITSVQIYTDPRLITHVPYPLEQALYSGQLGSGFDAILNFNATAMYFSRTPEEDIRALLRLSPRPGTEDLYGYHMF